jgi:hypothetical protein
VTYNDQGTYNDGYGDHAYGGGSVSTVRYDNANPSTNFLTGDLQDGGKDGGKKDNSVVKQAFIVGPNFTPAALIEETVDKIEMPTLWEELGAFFEKGTITYVAAYTLSLKSDQFDEKGFYAAELVKEINQQDITSARATVQTWNKKHPEDRIVFRYLSIPEFKGMVKGANGDWRLPPVSADGKWDVKYITPDFYISAKSAQAFLALPRSPQVGVFTFESWILRTKNPPGPGVYSPVIPQYKQPGLGREATIREAFPVIGGFPLNP